MGAEWNRQCLSGCLLLTIVLSCAIVTRVSAEDATRHATGPLYVTLQGSDGVESLLPARLLAGLDGAHYVAVSGDGKRLLVSSASRPEAYLVDTTSGKLLKTFEVGSQAQGVQFSPDGSLGLAISADEGTVAVVDVGAMVLRTKIPVGKEPHNAVFTRDGSRAYVTLQGEGRVAVLDMNTLEKVGEIAVPGLGNPHNLDLSADENQLWIRGFNGRVAVLDLRTRAQLALISVGASHAGIDVVPGGRYVVTGGIGDRYLAVIDQQTRTVVKRIDVGLAPHGVRASADGRWIHAGVLGSDELVVVDARTLAVVDRVPLQGKVPFWIAVPGND